MTGPALIGNTRQRPRQLRLFNLRDPLTVRFGAHYFRSLPAQPGVYLFYGSEDDLLYIGQSSDLKTRIGSYRHVTTDKNPGRTLRLVSRITRIEWRTCITAAEAVELERILLLEHRPPFNRAGVWQGDPWWLNVKIEAGKGTIQSLAKSIRHGVTRLTRESEQILTRARKAKSAPINSTHSMAQPWNARSDCGPSLPSSPTTA